ncbi:MAG: DNA N-6-adenine-methyltransferase [Nitrososphaera sp.]|jgi:site-specific DNA-methyltransferase (adenine-specific)
MSKSVQHLQNIKVQDEYGTPTEIFEQACRDFHVQPRLDVCATEKNTKCPLFYTKYNDALSEDWQYDFFMNPPYSRVAEFIKYAYEQHKKCNVNALILTYAKTDTVWWHEYIEGKAEIHFIQGRLKFLDQNGTITKNSAPYPSVWIIYRRNSSLEIIKQKDDFK